MPLFRYMYCHCISTVLFSILWANHSEEIVTSQEKSNMDNLSTNKEVVGHETTRHVVPQLGDLAHHKD